MMFILTMDGKEKAGAYAVEDKRGGGQILYIFEEEDDAVRFAYQLEERGYPEMHVIEVEDDVIVRTCEVHNYRYSVITEDDIVIPPEEDAFI